MFGLQGKRVVITGAGGGVGGALVKGFAEAGAHVLACDRPGASLDGLPAAERHHFDLTDRAAVIEAVGDLVGPGAPAVVVSNAGLTRAETFAHLDHDGLEHELTVNFRGAAHLTLELLPAMRAAGGGSIVVISSVNSLMHFGNPAYSAAKAALNAWARSLAAEEGANGIRANVIAPGSIRTPAWDRRVERDPSILDRVASFYPLGRMVETTEVAHAALFLASPLASGITGATLPVDCGLTASYLPFIREIA